MASLVIKKNVVEKEIPGGIVACKKEDFQEMSIWIRVYSAK